MVKRGIENQRLVVAVHRHAVAIGALRQPSDAGQRRFARGVEDAVAEPVQIGDFELVHHFGESPAAFVVARGAGVNVALDLQRLAHIGAHQTQQILVHAALVGELHDGNRQAFLKHLPPVRPHAEPADIDDMDRVGE